MKRFLAFGFTLLLFLPSCLSAQDLDERLQILKPMMSKQWIGHYVGSTDSEIEHAVRWDSILDGKAVKFTMETTYFWDQDREELRFLQLTNRGASSVGTVHFEEDRVTLLGSGADGASEFKQTFAIGADGTLADYFYREEGGALVQGHFIEYDLTTN
ncbi:MAG: hypothetical protein HOH43_14255 [Candidatus Latescibacteria bacterium]|nr:hypothetical protein [Candidatus Latescibacterota bacterium]